MERVDPEGQALLFTVGHSNHPLEVFVELLNRHKIQVLVDSRSSPYSKYVPQFNKEELQQAIERTPIKYLYMGGELGGRPDADEFYDDDGHVLYYLLAESPAFRAGIERLENGIRQYRVALMCSEEDPSSCHRQLLVGRVMAERGVKMQHIRGDGTIQEESREAGGKQLLLFNLPEENPWRSLRPVPRKEPPRAAEASEEAAANDLSMSD